MLVRYRAYPGIMAHPAVNLSTSTVAIAVSETSRFAMRDAVINQASDLPNLQTLV